MLCLTLVLEDNIVIAQANQDPDRKEGHDWMVTMTDVPTGKTVTMEMSNLQLSAAAALAIGYGEENDADPDVIKKLYEVAEPLFKDKPIEIRFIP